MKGKNGKKKVHAKGGILFIYWYKYTNISIEWRAKMAKKKVHAKGGILFIYWYK
jgi:hypothetical protein